MIFEDLHKQISFVGINCANSFQISLTLRSSSFRSHTCYLPGQKWPDT